MMNYIPLGKTGLKVSSLGLGTEYLLDQPKETVRQVVRTALDHGINYIDFFYGHPEIRDHLGAALADGYREKALVTGHLGAIANKGQYAKTRDIATCEKYFEDLLTRLRTDYIDVLFLHNVDTREDYDTVFADYLELARKYKQAGRARVIAFSGHTLTTSRQAAESGEIDILMYPVNFTVPRNELLEITSVCREREIALVAMKPFAGGKILEEKKASPIQCLHYALSFPGVTTVLPGLKDLSELTTALSYLGAGDEVKDFSGPLSEIRDDLTGECAYCNHCLPCPAGIDIGRTFRLLDTGDTAGLAALPVPPSACTKCGACEKRCPFGVKAVGKMAGMSDIHI